MAEPRRPPGTGPRQELLLRLRYPAWCDDHGIDPLITGFQDSIGWRLLGLPAGAFERVGERVGLTLLFSVHEKKRLLRGSGRADARSVRWALGRAQFVPDGVAAAMKGQASAGPASRYAVEAMRACLLDEAPCLWPRQRLRFDRDDVSDEDRSRPFDRVEEGYLAQLWKAALSQEQSERAEGDGARNQLKDPGHDDEPASD